jgi:VWFA-related protein
LQNVASVAILWAATFMRDRSACSSRRFFLAGSGLTLTAGALGSTKFLRAQTSQAQDANSAESPAVFSSNVRVVNVLATVRTRGGAIVADLTKDDFVLSEDGRAQTIQYFSRETNLALIVGLMVDTSASQRNVLAEEKAASFRFLDQVLREDVDKAFIVHFDFSAELLQAMTSSRPALRRGLDAIGTPVAILAAAEGGATTLYDAVGAASNEVMHDLRGRKALVLLSDGVDHGSHFSLGGAIEAAQRADTMVYSILFAGDEGDSDGSLAAQGARVMQRISHETGGGYFEVSSKLKIDAIYARIEDELRSQYSIGYAPDRPLDGGAFRTISLDVRRKDLVVQCRQGYYPPR